MDLKAKYAALGTAAVVGLAGAGVFAGALATQATGQFGAGNAAAPSSCTDSVNVAPGPAAFDPTDATYEISSAVVSGNLDECLGAAAFVNVIYNDAEISATNPRYTITPADVTAGEFTVTLNTAVVSQT